MSHDVVSKIFEMLSYDGIQCLDQNNVSLPKKFPSRQGQLIRFRPKLPNLMFHDSFSEKFFEISWHNGVQCIDKNKVSQFSKKKAPFGVIWAQSGPKLHNLY